MIYLVHGDDDARLDEWRARLRRRAEAAAGPGALETIDARSGGPDVVAAALSAMTLTTSERFILVDGVESWRPGDLEPVERELSSPPEATTLLLIARGKPPPRLAKAVDCAGGDERECRAPKPWEMPGWVTERARDSGLTLEREAAKALVARVGARQQRLLREIEKLVVAAHPRTRLSADELRELVAADVDPQVYDLADALVAGDTALAVGLAERLIDAGERPSGLIYALVRRLRDVQRVTELLDAGVPEASAKASVKMAPWAWKRTVAQARRADREAIEAALCAFSDLEIELRGGGTGLDEETAFSLTLTSAAA